MNPATSEAPGLAGIALSVVAGQRDAERLLLTLREGVAPPDLLAAALMQVQAQGDPEMQRAWCRRLQKALERTA